VFVPNASTTIAHSFASPCEERRDEERRGEERRDEERRGEERRDEEQQGRRAG